MTNKQIVEAQKLLRKLESTPVRVQNEQGMMFWQVTYDDSTYRMLLKILTDVASIPIKEYDYTPRYVSNTVQPSTESVTTYHRDKIE